MEKLQIRRDMANPSRADLFDHMQHAFDEGRELTVFFLEDNGRIRLRVLGIEHESGAGDSFNIHGYAGEKRFTGYYHTGRRSGVIELKD